MKRIITIFLTLFTVASFASDDHRLVVIDGSLTEIVYALGAGEAIVAIDDTSVYPAEAKALPSVGYMRALSTEGVLSVNPSHVLMTDSAGPVNVINHLKNSHLALNIIENTASLEGVRQKIRQVAKAVDKTREAESLLVAFNKKTANLDEKLNANKSFFEGKKALVFLGMQANQFMAAGKHTKAQAVIDMLLLTNAVSHNGYKPLSQEAILALNPDIVIIATRGKGDVASLKAGLKMTHAYKNNAIVIVDSEKLLSFGPRLPEALMQIATRVTQPKAAQ